MPTNKHTPNLRSIVAKDNEIIEQMAKFGLSELRLIAYCLAHYDSRSQENIKFDATVADLQQVFPITSKDSYAVVRRTVIGLGSKPLEIREGNARHFWNWFSGFTYYETEGRFTFRINPDLQPRLLGLKGQFTKYRLVDVYQFRSASSWKLYELLKRWVKKRAWEVDVEELRLLLGVAGKYPRWSSLDQRIISPSTNEINEVSDLNISYEKIKRGRSVVGIAFRINHKENDGKPEPIDAQTPREELLVTLIGYGVNPTSAEEYTASIAEAQKVDVILPKITKMAKLAKEKNIPLPKYILGSIKKELSQRNLFDIIPTPVADHSEALNCWQEKKQTGEKCKVRVKGQAGQRKKCQICLEKLPIDTWGI